MNHISGTRTLMLAFDGDMNKFYTYLVGLLKRGIQQTSTHVPAQAPPLLPASGRNTVPFLDTIGPNPHVLIVALLVRYHTLLRQSNLFYSDSVSDPEHTLRVKDITPKVNGLIISVRFSNVYEVFTRGQHNRCFDA